MPYFHTDLLVLEGTTGQGFTLTTVIFIHESLFRSICYTELHTEKNQIDFWKPSKNLRDRPELKLEKS